MAQRGRAMEALLILMSGLALVAATDTETAALHYSPGASRPLLPPLFDFCKQCCAAGRRCPPACPPCRPDAVNPCSRVRCPGPGPCVVRNGQAVCLGADGEGECPIESDLLNLDGLRCSRSSCIGDSDCGRKQKCCRRGRCGHHCTPACFPPCVGNEQCRIDPTPPVCLGSNCPPPRPVTASCRAEPQPGLGQCPQVDPSSLPCPPQPAPIHECSIDADCGGDGYRRCCSDGCSRRCLPTCSPPCSSGQSCKLRTHRAFDCPIGRCPPPRHTASCEPEPGSNPCAATLCRVGTRCEVQGGVGVCVPIAAGGRVCPKNDQISACTFVVNPDQCRSDAECGPLEKCCSQGCGRQCVSSCRAPCGPGQECVLEHFATCLAIGCPPAPPPRATCRPRDPTVPTRPTSPPVREGTCPIDTFITTCEVRPDACYSDGECAAGERCCSRGCGRTCTPVCRDCDGPDQICELKQVQCIRAPCPPLPFCRQLQKID